MEPDVKSFLIEIRDKASALLAADDPAPPLPARYSIPSPQLSTTHRDWPAYSARVASVVASNVYSFEDWSYRPTQILYWWDADGRRNNAVRDYAVGHFRASLLRAAAKWERNEDLTEFSGDQYLVAAGIVRDWCLVLNWCGGEITAKEKFDAERILACCIDNMRGPKRTDGYVDAFWGKDAVLYKWPGWAQDNPGNNYWYNHLEAVVTWALHSNDPEWLDHLRNEMLPALKEYSEKHGGGSREGTSYGKSHRTLFRVLWLWQQATGEVVEAKVSDHLEYWIAVTTPDFKSHAPFGDQVIGSYPHIASANGDYLRSLMLWGLRLTGSPEARWWIEQDKHPAHYIPYWETCLDPTPGPTEKPSTATYLSPGGHLIAKDDATGTMLTVTAGDVSEAHMSLCQGEFHLYHDGKWVIASANIWSHTGIRQSSKEHCVPQLGEQSRNECFFAYDDDDGRLLANADLYPAYNHTLRRRISWNRKAQELIISDSDGGFRCFVSDKPNINGDTVTAGKLSIRRLGETPIVSDCADLFPPDDNGPTYAPDTVWCIDFAGPGLTEISYQQDSQEPSKMLAPLDTAHTVIVAQEPVSGQVPNLGLSSIPLVLDATNPPSWDSADSCLHFECGSPTNGKYEQQQCGTIDISPDEWNAGIVAGKKTGKSFTLYARVRRRVSGQQSLYFLLAEFVPVEFKHLMCYVDAGNSPYQRVWANNASNSQVVATNAAADIPVNTWTDFGMRWTHSTKTLDVLLNGVVVGTSGSVAWDWGPPMSYSGSTPTPFYFLRAGTTLPNTCDIKCMSLHIGVDLTDQDVANLGAAYDDVLSGDPPPPPPPPDPPGELKFFVNGIERPGASGDIDGVPIEAPTAAGSPDKIVTVTYQE